ncbi:MAG: DAK2 domain-containing protein [Lachnospiraceae bacterium]|nr:DAK2 domain-containing protein [Lachnospiraceae bacterium]
MIIKTIDAAAIQKCFLAGANALDAKKELINDLNVFPVPDGDTGTNMTMTIMSAAREVAALEDTDMEKLCKAISSGSLRGARGNSGVILSQLLRGFTKEISKVEAVDVYVLTKAFERAVESAYRAVMKPKEGTILTVARGGAEKALEVSERTDNLLELVNSVLMHMRDVLEQTPDMLPVLKEAGVVDSGGEGLLTILEGAYDALLGKDVNYEVEKEPSTPLESTMSGADAGVVSEADIKFGYCTEFIIMLEKEFHSKEEKEFKSYLESIGDSIVCVADEDLVKVHVHTNDPGLAIQKALTYGSLTRMKIDNMREEHNERVIRDAEKKAAEQKEAEGQPEQEMPMEHRENGFISVSVGDGLNDIFRDLGVDYVIEGGQTMNPSTEDILEATRHINADNVFILPNNSNIILAAEQAKELIQDKNIVVIPSKNIPQGIAAMVNYTEGLELDENIEAMAEALSTVRSGQVTYAVRDTAVDGKEIKAGDIMGLSDKTIETVGTDVVETTIDLLKKMMDEESELVSIYYGEEGNQEDAEKIAEAVQQMDSEVEVEIQYGGQPIYYYFVSVE